MRLVLLLLGGLFAASSASAACSEIRFAPGAYSGEVEGYVIDGEPRCFTFGTGAGQTARLQIFGSDNTCFTVPGIADCRDELSFSTRRRDYQVNVFQLFRKVSYDPFTLRLTIK